MIKNWLSYNITVHERNQQLDMNTSKCNWIRISSAESDCTRPHRAVNGIISDLSKLFL